EIYLTPPPKDGKQAAGPQKSKSGTPTGIDRIVLCSSVNMNLVVDSRSGFVGTGKSRPTDKGVKAVGTPQQGRPPTTRPPGQEMQKGALASEQKAQLVVVSPGSFDYDMHARRAVFDCGHQAGPLPNLVKVTRINEGNNDNLSCDHLVLQFQEAAGKT